MATGQESNISPETIDALNAQYHASQVPDQDVQEKLEHQYRLRNGDYDLTSVAGLAQGGLGVAENVGQMISGFYSAVPGAISGVVESMPSLGVVAGAYSGAHSPEFIEAQKQILKEGIQWDRYPEAFGAAADPTTYEPRSVKGKKIAEGIENAYNTYIGGKWHEYIAENVENGTFTPAEGTYYRTSADAFMMGIFMRGAQALRRTPKSNEKIIDIDLEPVEGEYIPRSGGRDVAVKEGVTIEGETGRPRITEQKKLQAPEESVPLIQAINKAADQGQPLRLIQEAVKESKTVEEAVVAINEMEVFHHGSPRIFDEFSRVEAYSGKGMQAYGDGIYLSTRKGVAEAYVKDGGAIYEVSIPKVDTAKFLDQSKALTEQNPAIQDALKKLSDEVSDDPNYFENQYGEILYEDLVELLQSKELASNRLQKANIPGMRFFAGTENAILFDTKLIAQTKRNGRTTQSIFKNKQAGAVDPEVFVEGVKIIARPGILAAKGAADLGHAIARQIAFKHVTDIRKLDSPTAKMLADRLMPLETSTIPLEAGFHELVSMSEGKFNTRIENILAPLRRHVINKNATSSARIIALPKKINDALYRALDTGKVPESLEIEARALRAILNELAEYQTEAGVQLASRFNYMPHMWDDIKISKERYLNPTGGGFYNWLVKEKGFSPNAAKKTISNIIHEEGFLDFIQDSGGRLTEHMDYNAWGRAQGIGGGAAKPGHMKQRTIETNIDEAGNWLVTDIEAVLSNYIRHAVLKAEYTRITGNGEGKLNQMVKQIIEEQDLANQSSGKLRAASPHETAQEIYDVFDAMQKRFHQIKNPAVRKASRAVAGFEVMKSLGYVALAQFPETLVPAIKYRVATPTKALPGLPIPMKSYAVGMAAAAQDGISSIVTLLTGKRLIPKSELRTHLERLGVIHVSALASSASRMVGPTGVMTARFIRAVGMESITDLQRMIALDTLQSMTRQNARYLSLGKTGKKARMYEQELTELGIPPEMAIDWYNKGMPKDHIVQDRLDTSIVRGVNTTITMPTAANAPRIYNDPRWQTVVLFTRFFTAFGNTVVKNVFKKMVDKGVTNTRKMASLSGIFAAIGVAYYTQFLREHLTGYAFRDESDPIRVIDAIDRSGWTAMFTRLYPLVSPYRYSMGSKYITSLGGPVASDIARGIEAAKGSDKQLARWMVSMTPVANMTEPTREAMYDFYLDLIESMD